MNATLLPPRAVRWSLLAAYLLLLVLTGLALTSGAAASVTAAQQRLVASVWTALSVAAGAGLGLVLLQTRNWNATELSWITSLRQLFRSAQGPAAEPDLPPQTSDLLADALNDLIRRFHQQNLQDQAQARQLSAVLDYMVEGVIAVDARKYVRFANRAAGQLLGFDPQQATDKSLNELVRHYTLNRLVDEATATQNLKRSELLESGTPRRILSVSVSPLPPQVGIAAALVLTDVSELRRLESLRQDLVANVSHELKTPLSSIKAYAETLLNGALHDERTNIKFLQGIDRQADRLHRLIMDMLSLARIESGRKSFEMTPVSVAKVIDTCLAQQATAAEQKGITLGRQLLAPQAVVLADEEGLREIFGNLIDNAIKYTQPGGKVDVICSTEPGMAVIDVTDTGIGIPTEHLSRLFERFYRVDKARSRELGGTGLGLSIVKHLCQVFRGNVSVSSVPQQGTTFRVCMPLIETNATTAGLRPGETPPADVEDNRSAKK